LFNTATDLEMFRELLLMTTLSHYHFLDAFLIIFSVADDACRMLRGY